MTGPGTGALTDAAWRWSVPTSALTPVVALLLLVVIPNAFFTYSADALVMQVAIVALHVATLVLCRRVWRLGQASVEDASFGRRLTALRWWHLVLVVLTIVGLVAVFVHFAVNEHVTIAIPIAALEFGGPVVTLAGLYRVLGVASGRSARPRAA